MAFDDKFVKSYNRSTLKILGSVGEPINPTTWLWYHDVVGDGKCAVVDTYWQTETVQIVLVYRGRKRGNHLDINNCANLCKFS
jgi:acetyl-CoA synthetase